MVIKLLASAALGWQIVTIVNAFDGVMPGVSNVFWGVAATVCVAIALIGDECEDEEY